MLVKDSGNLDIGSDLIWGEVVGGGQVKVRREWYKW